VFAGLLTLDAPIIVYGSLVSRGSFSHARSIPQGFRKLVAAARLAPLFSRRLISRMETHEDVWVCWRCDGLEDVSRVPDLSVGGLFLSTPMPRPLGMRAKIDFLVPEGQIRGRCRRSASDSQWRTGVEIHRHNGPGLPEPDSVDEQDLHSTGSPAGELTGAPPVAGIGGDGGVDFRLSPRLPSFVAASLSRSLRPVGFSGSGGIACSRRTGTQSSARRLG